MIQTSTYALTPKEFFKLIVENRIRRFWWLYLLMLLFSLGLSGKFGKDPVATGYILITMVYLPSIIIYLYFWAYSKKNSVLLIPRYLTITPDKIYSTSEGDIRNEIPLNFIISTVERKRYWLLYIAKSQFIYLPKSAFQTIEDEAEFQMLITSVKKKYS